VDDEFNDFNYYRGNVYTKHEITEDGTVKVLGPDEVSYDTLSNGRIVARNLPGEISTVPITKDDTYLRPNFSESDNRNYRDGDVSSTRYYNNFGEVNDPSQRMYNSPVHTATVDSTGGQSLQYDTSTGRTTLIDDNVRVYKGGSWRDRAYWLDPAQRRYFPQDMATDYIGFRNAMSRVGSKSLSKNKTAGN
jgi:gliding motility-associated lipoprotein GldJ